MPYVRNFLDCVKSRAQPACNADVARWLHVAGHAAAIAWMLDHKVAFDPVKEAFIGDDKANRMRTRGHARALAHVAAVLGRLPVNWPG